MKLHKINGYDAYTALLEADKKRKVRPDHHLDPADVHELIGFLADSGFFIGVPDRDMIPASDTKA